MSHEMSLLRGTPIEVDGVGGIYPLKLSEIEELGTKRYQEMLFHILFDRRDIDVPELRDLIESDETTDFDIVFALCIFDESFRSNFFSSLKLFTKLEPSISDEGFFYLSGIEENKIIHRDNFDEIRTIIRKQNMLDDATNKKSKNKRVQQLKEKAALFRNMSNSKEKKKDGLTLEKIISIVASNSPSLNHLTIWDYTLYELYNYFNSMMKRDSYQQQWSLLLQGADIKSSDLKHWAT